MKSKNLKIFILYLIFLFTVVPNANSLTLQELIDSYNFDYNDGTLNVNLFSDSMADSNLNGQNDVLIINLTVNSTYASNFEIYFDLSESSGTLSNRVNQSLIASVSKVNMSFDTRLLTKNKYNYSVRIYNTTGILVFSKYNVETNIYNVFENGTSINIIRDENLNDNYLRINLTLNITQNQSTNITIFLKFNETIIGSTKNETLVIGAQTVSIDFDNETIKSTHYNGNFTLDSVLIGKKLFKPSYTTSIYNYEDFAKTSYFRNYSSSGIDTNTNNLSEFLEINFTVTVKNANTFDIQTEIYDQFNNFVRNVSASQSLSVGNQTVSVRLNGSDIYATKISGPYVLSITKLIENSNIIDKQFEPHIISNLTYTDFERPPLPDLKVIMNASFNETTNITNVYVNVSNSGESSAFNIFIDLFNNETFSVINSTVLLNVNESQIYNFVVINTSNITLFTAIADFDNLVDESDESNNIAQNSQPQVVSLKIDSITTMYSNGTLKIFEFVIVNDGETTVTEIQWWFDTNDSYRINSTSNISSLAVNEKAFVYLHYNYSNEGSYNIKANATGLSQSTLASSTSSSTIGVGDLTLTNFDDLNITETKVIFEIQAKNNLAENLTNVNWSLATGDGFVINSTQKFTSIKPNEVVFIYVNYDYGTSGTFNPIFSITNGTYADSESITINVQQLGASSGIFIDTTEINWSAGTFNNMATQGTGASANLTSSGRNVSGSFGSQVFDATATANWANITIATEVPYGTEIGRNANDSITTSNQSQYFGFINTSGLVVLYYFNNESEFGENNSIIRDYSTIVNEQRATSKTANATCSTSCSNYSISNKKLGRYGLDLNQSVWTVNTPSVDWKNAITISTWIYVKTVMPTGTTPSRFISGSNSSTSDVIRVTITQGNGIVFSEDNGVSTCTAPSNVLLNDTWHHIAITKSKANNVDAIYIDGIDMATDKTCTGGESATYPTWYLGNLQTGARLLNATIDEFSIWNRSLSQAEVRNLYKRGALRLNISVRSCDDSACVGEPYTKVANLSFMGGIVPLNLSTNRYFQYNFTFTSNATNTNIDRVVINNVSIEY